jgi:FixJ family two-component response regulator
VTRAPVIAVVDDDAAVRHALSSLVRSVDMIARHYGSAADFLDAGDIAETACLVTDIQMPVIDGFTMYETLLARGLRIPVIFMTAFPEPAVRERAARLGAQGFLSKPFFGPSVLRCIDVALGRDPHGPAAS